MNNLNRYITKLVQDTIRKYSSEENPNFDEICSGLGLVVKEGVFRLGTDGIQSGKTIIINSRIQNKERKRFTAFHEVMHYLIGNDDHLISILNELTYNQMGEYDRQLEKFCNIGAAEFLMPSEKFRKLSEEKGFNVELILYAANYFKSSTIAATIQLAQVAPNECITAICEFTHDGTPPLQPQIFNQKEKLPRQKLRVIYSASSPTVKYKLAKSTVIPYDQPIHDAFLQDKPIEAESYVPFRSGRKMPCQCEALAERNRVYVIFHLTPPTLTDQKQMKLFSSAQPTRFV